VAAALISLVASIVVPMCPVYDSAGRPAWRVDAVHDGDTVTCIDPEGRSRKIRLQGIDAPEFGQPYGDWSRQLLRAKLANRPVRVEGDAIDQHGRLLGTRRGPPGSSAASRPTRILWPPKKTPAAVGWVSGRIRTRPSLRNGVGCTRHTADCSGAPGTPLSGFAPVV
jgi:hypothetical protein